MKTSLLPIFLVLFFGLGFVPNHPDKVRSGAAYQNDENVSFKWAFGALAGKD